MVVIVTGPVGGGKSTVASALANSFRDSARRAAVIDLDLVYCMARQVEGYSEEDVWRAAQRGAAALADAFFAEGMEVVIVDGEFFAQEALDTLQSNLATKAALRFVTLMVPVEEALRRALQDPNRRVPDPDFLRWQHSQFMKALPFLRVSSLLVDAHALAPCELAELIGRAVSPGATSEDMG